MAHVPAQPFVFLAFFVLILWCLPAQLFCVSIPLLSVGFESCCSDLGLWLLQCLLWRTLAHTNTVRHMVGFWGCPVQGWELDSMILVGPFQLQDILWYFYRQKNFHSLGNTSSSDNPCTFLVSTVTTCIQRPLDNDVPMMCKADSRQTLLRLPLVQWSPKWSLSQHQSRLSLLSIPTWKRKSITESLTFKKTSRMESSFQTFVSDPTDLV